jgi:hypothetical protein
MSDDGDVRTRILDLGDVPLARVLQLRELAGLAGDVTRVGLQSADFGNWMDDPRQDGDQDV